MRIKLTLSYDGSQFSGFQTQKHKRTVQGVVEEALEKLYITPVKITGSGRTDAGVHALGQVAHYDAGKLIDENKIISALNFFLPADVKVYKAEYVDDNFNARKSAKQKTYLYDIYLSGFDNPLILTRACRVNQDIDIEKMRVAAKLFEGKHDFKEFHCTGSSAKTTIRTVYQCGFEELILYGEKALRFTICANGFLYKMVRIIAGALIKTGQGFLTDKDISAFLNCEEKYMSKVPAPACGLYLENVDY